MGRSNTLPIGRSHDPEKGQLKPSTRSATTTFEEPAHSSKHHIHLPHVHIPFTAHNDHHTPPQTSAPSRPNGGLNRQNSVQTRYMNMLLAMDTIPRMHNIFAAFFTWILLAGFVVLPGTFTSLQTLEDKPEVSSSETASAILKTVKNIPLLVIAGSCCGIGALGMVWLWFKWRSNYVWLLNRIFLPGCLNSLAGLISSLINVYTQQDGAWSVTAKVTAIATGSSMVVTGVLFGLYNFWILEKVKRRHGREMDAVNGGEEGLVEKIGKKMHEPALEPGSVV
ncbi:hypothetical protein IFR04_010082 [Cadophora malorum]|uniref:Uncharacterized protein n=1 Tax=Cadophora malorum TaxID=108018 RepID=A0A8H7TDD6_9HELO|nr:hypothetical protein IFR04_010082 [Cadophora malorum]